MICKILDYANKRDFNKRMPCLPFSPSRRPRPLRRWLVSCFLSWAADVACNSLVRLIRARCSLS